MVTSIHTAEHYIWGEACDGWHLHKSPTLSISQERIPPGTGETLHFHSLAQQVFFMLSGTATFEVEKEVWVVSANQSIYISPETKHRIINHGAHDLHFLVISEPKAQGDRVNLY